jgi:putative hydrolase of the HAD superfamily
MAEIRAVLWDVGGVLLTNGWDHCGRAELLREFGVDRAAFEARHEEANDLWEKGRITIREYLDRTLFYEPRSFTPDQFIARMEQESQWIPNTAVEVLRTLSVSKQVRVAMLSNESRELMDYRIATFGLDQLFPVCFCSAYVGLRKPDPAIFRLALDVLRVQPEEAVFVDDRKENAQAATDLGIHGVHYAGPEPLKEQLQRLGVKLG